jgi:hypothetical protein
MLLILFVRGVVDILLPLVRLLQLLIALASAPAHTPAPVRPSARVHPAPTHAPSPGPALSR